MEIKPPTPAIGPDGAKEMVESIEFSGWATEMFHIPNEADREKLREMIYEYKDASTPGSCP